MDKNSKKLDISDRILKKKSTAGGGYHTLIGVGRRKPEAIQSEMRLTDSFTRNETCEFG
jgi:hypothetical protein